MLNSQKISIRLSEVRQRLNELAGVEETLTDEQRQESEKLQTEFADSEVRYRSAVIAEGAEADLVVTQGDAETRELQRLTERANVGDILSATFEKRQTSGAIGRASTALRHRQRIRAPLEMLRINRSVEERAAATVPASIGDASQAEVITPVFASGDGAFLQIERPTVPVGDGSFPILSTMPSVKGPFTDSTEAAQTDAEFVATNLSPERLQASFAYRQDRRGHDFRDLMLRSAWLLTAGLQEKLDQQAIEGADGLLTATNLPNANVSTQTTFQLYLSPACLYGRVDGQVCAHTGRHPDDRRTGNFHPCVLHFQGQQLRRKRSRTSTGKKRRLDGIAPTFRAVSGNKQNALDTPWHRSGAGPRKPLWQGVSLVVDEYSRSAAHGEDDRARHPAGQLRNHPQGAVAQTADPARLSSPSPCGASPGIGL